MYKEVVIPHCPRLWVLPRITALVIHPLVIIYHVSFINDPFSELRVVIADGSLVTANAVEHSDRTLKFIYPMSSNNIVFSKSFGLCEVVELEAGVSLYQLPSTPSQPLTLQSLS